MKKLTLSKNSKLCIGTIALIILFYIAEKLFEMFGTPNKPIAIGFAMASTLIFAISILVISKSDNVYYGLLTAVIGYKMIPVQIVFLWGQSKDAYILYYLVGKAALVTFAVLAYKVYREQPHPREIKALPIIAILFAVPFFNEIGGALTDYFLDKTGSLLFGYFSQFACYTAAILIILGISYIHSLESTRFAVCFEIIAISINIVKMGGKIIVKTIEQQHISKSYYCWIIIFIGLFIISMLTLKNKSQKSA